MKDLHEVDDGGDYSGDCATTVCDPCDVNHLISDDENTTDFDSCDDTTDLTTMVCFNLINVSMQTLQ